MNPLTAYDVYAVKAPREGQTIKWDAMPKGFGVRVTASGARSYIFNYRYDDPNDRRKSSQYRYTIGKAKSSPRDKGLPLEEARKVASEWANKIALGIGHPLGDRRGRRDAAQAARKAETFKEAFADYIEHEQKGRKGNLSANEVARSVLKHTGSWYDRPVKDITAQEIGKLLRQLRDGDGKADPRPYLSNRLHAFLRTFFAWCAKPDVRKTEISPMLGMSKPWENEEVRDRVFNDKELKAIWRAADEIGGTASAFLKLALLTGKRKSALASMRWSEIDAAGVWSPPVDPRRRKRNKRLHGIPLPKLALRVLAPMKPKLAEDANNGFVFSGRSRHTHLYPGSKLATQVQNTSKVTDFFYHACRHTLETRLAELKVAPHVRDILLDHAPARGAGAGYDHHHYRDEMADALEQWASHIQQLVTPEGTRALR